MAHTTATPWHPALTALGALVELPHPDDYAHALLHEHGEPGTVDDALTLLLDLAATSVHPDLERICRHLLEEHAPNCRSCGHRMAPIELAGGWHCATGGCPDAWPAGAGAALAYSPRLMPLPANCPRCLRGYSLPVLVDTADTTTRLRCAFDEQLLVEFAQHVANCPPTGTWVTTHPDGTETRRPVTWEEDEDWKATLRSWALQSARQMRVQEIQSRLAAAARGPWEVVPVADGEGITRLGPADQCGRHCDHDDATGHRGFTLDDERLIANAPGDLAWLLDRVAELEQENAALRAAQDGSGS